MKALADFDKYETHRSTCIGGGGVENAPINAVGIGADAFALFTKNQRQWVAKALTVDSINLFKGRVKESGLDTRYILPHDSYLINLGHPDRKQLPRAVTHSSTR